jgi:hypothetical protein
MDLSRTEGSRRFSSFFDTPLAAPQVFMWNNYYLNKNLVFLGKA